MKRPPLRASVSEKGRLQFVASQRQELDAYLLTLVGKDVDVDIREHKSRRSLAQNARYWALLTVGADSIWGDKSLKDDLHEEVAHLLLGLPPCEKTGMRRRERTPKLNTAEFGRYMDRVAEKLIEFGADLTAWDEETRRLEAA